MRMKAGFSSNLKEYFWNSVNKITKNFTSLTVTIRGDGYIKCFWQISPIDNFRIELSKSCFYAIRLFDISNSRNKANSTCIMKEIQVNKFQTSISFPIPINKGVYYFEFGYRKKNGQWRKLACQNLNLGYRIKKEIPSYENDNWFSYKKTGGNVDLGLHEEAYQLSINTSIGGSEEIIYDQDNI